MLNAHPCPQAITHERISTKYLVAYNRGKSPCHTNKTEQIPQCTHPLDEKKLQNNC